MKRTDLGRRRLMFNNPISGTLTACVGTDTVMINDSAGVALNTLTIKGKTIQPIPDRGEEYRDYIKDISNYAPAGMLGCYYLKLPAEWVNAGITYALKEKDQMIGVTVELSDNANALFASTVRLLEADGTLNTFTGSGYPYLLVSGINGDDIEDENGDIIHVLTELTELWDSYELSAIAPICFDIPTPVLNAGSDGLILMLEADGTKTTYELPKSLTLDGRNLLLLMSEYDSIYMDLKSRRVVYKEGSYRRLYSGTESLSVYGTFLSRGMGVFYLSTLATTCAMDEGYSQYVAIAPNSNPVGQNIFCVRGANAYFKWNEEDTSLTIAQQRERINYFKNMIKNKLVGGSPLEILCRRISTVEHDITNTELGKTLLSLVIPRGRSGTLSIKGSVGVSSLEASYYSLNGEEEERAMLEIRYLNEGGAEISASRTHEIRLGSKYQIVAPHIAGYTRTEETISGTIDSDTTINLIYKEAE